MGHLNPLEFSVARHETHTSGLRGSGHLVKAQPYGEGRRAGAIIANKRLGIRHRDLFSCLLYTADGDDELHCVECCGSCSINKKKR